MEQRLFIQLLASFVILISVFLPWLDATALEHYVGSDASFMDICKYIAHEDDKASVVAFIPWVVIITAVINIVMILLKRTKLVSVLLFLGFLSTLAIFVAVIINELDAPDLIAMGFYIGIIGLILLIIGIFLKDNKTKTIAKDN